MDTATLSAAIVAAIAAAISAGATVVIVRGTARTRDAYQKQREIGQAHVASTQAQTSNQMRPVLIPPVIKESGLLTTKDGKPLCNGSSSGGLIAKHRIGVGPAFNISGIFFGSPFQGVPPFNQRYVIWNSTFLLPGAPGNQITRSPRSSLRSETLIKEHVPYVPDDAEQTARIVRLTLTYHDISGHTFARIYDEHPGLGWVWVGHCEDIEQDLHELDEQTPMTQRSNHMASRMSKMQP